MKVLFVCNKNENRSKTAEKLFKLKFETKSAGLFNETPIEGKDLKWADTIVVMEDKQREEIGKRFPKEYMKKRIISLGIEDVYSFDQPELKKKLEHKVAELL